MPSPQHQSETLIVEMDETFIVEKDVWETVVRDIIFKRTGEKPMLHPVLLFPITLSAAESNYDTDNLELQRVVSLAEGRPPPIGHI